MGPLSCVFCMECKNVACITYVNGCVVDNISFKS